MDEAQLVTASMRSTDVVARLVMTLDGYMCPPDGAADYLNKYPLEEFDFSAWSDRLGALVMELTTYTQTLEWGWSSGDRPTRVLTTTTDLPVPDRGDVTFRAAPTAQAITEFAVRTDKRVWAFGGGNLVTAELNGGAAGCSSE